jgi:hypothetical protein
MTLGPDHPVPGQDYLDPKIQKRSTEMPRSTWTKSLSRETSSKRLPVGDQDQEIPAENSNLSAVAGLPSFQSNAKPVFVNNVLA